MSDTIDNTKLEKSQKPSRLTEGQYAILMETNGKECESWYYFIRVKGNEDNLHHLQHQLEKVDWYVLDELSVFELDLDNYVTAKTAKQMTKVDLNHHSFHRKFDGKLQRIRLGFRKRDSNERMIEKSFDLLGYGQIEDYIQDEDIDSEDMVSGSESETETNTEDESDSEDNKEEDTEKQTVPDDNSKLACNRVKRGIPPSLLQDNRPRWAKAKGKRNHRRNR